MKTKREDLKHALEIVKPGLASKEKIEQTTSFAFMEGSVVTYNEEISISHPVEGLNIEGAIKADQLYQFINKLKQDEIEITLSENEIVIESGRSKAGFSLQSEIKLPLDDIAKATRWKKLPDSFLKALSFVTPFAGKSLSRPILTCVHVVSEGMVEASDGFCIVRYNTEKIPCETFLIPAASMHQVIQINPTHISKQEGWVHFKSDEGTIISCRIYYGDSYPDTQSHIDCEGFEITLPRTITAILERALIFSQDDTAENKAVTITLVNNRFRVESASATGWFKEEANIKYSDEPVSFEIMPYLLQKILSQSMNCIVCEDRLKFQTEDWVYVTSLKSPVK